MNSSFLLFTIQILKTKIQYGMSLRRYVPADNTDRALPIDHVEAGKYIEAEDDRF